MTHLRKGAAAKLSRQESAKLRSSAVALVAEAAPVSAVKKKSTRRGKKNATKGT